MSDDMPRTRTRRDQASVGEVFEFVKIYAKQETVGPLKGAGRWLAYGAAGALSLGLGLSLLLLGLLRVLQTEGPWSAQGRWTWVSYLIVLVVCAALLVLTMMRIGKTFLNKDSSVKENLQ